MDPTPNDYRDIAIIGGGCYGTFYARQLTAARRRGKIRCRSVITVDHDPDCAVSRETGVDTTIVGSDWGDFLDQFLDRPAPGRGDPDDAIVPSPLMPHLLAEWLTREARRRWPDRAVSTVPVERPLGTPYDVLGADGTRFVSFADWLCPTHCVEPHVCPVIRAPRTWEMSDALGEYVAKLGRARPTVGPALFVTRHRAFGVGMFDLSEVRSARALMMTNDAGADLVVATISSCHGAVSILRSGPK